MGFRRRFGARLTARILLLFLALGLASLLAAYGRAPTAMLLAVGFVLVLTIDLWRLVNESNTELARFVGALERADLTQSFAWTGRGAGFDRLGQAYERALQRLRQEKASSAGAAAFAAALADGAPTPLLVLGPGEAVMLGNKAARRLFGRAAPATLAALEPFGSGFVASLRIATPGTSKLSHIVADGLSQRVVLDTTRIDAAGETRKVVSVKVIQAELDGAELMAQIDLVRVLTHEIMNSLTPVTSLAQTAKRLLEHDDGGAAPGIVDARLAIEALARRAGELERFIDTYKGFSEAPALHRATIDVADWLAKTAMIHNASPGRTPVVLDIATGLPPLEGDGALLTQVLLNLLKNASEAVVTSEAPMIRLAVDAIGKEQLRIAVIDNGCGIPPHLARDVFLPFFTTKPHGSGIGLSLARQIVLLHGGQIEMRAAAVTEVVVSLPLGRR
jgi:nitrogen fixation/metabolism regulation signal transduction histidine kinase